LENRSGEGVRLCLRQSIIHKEYLFYLYKFFFNKDYCSINKPRKYNRTIKGRDKIYSGFEFNTFTFRSFLWIYNLFYKKGKKVISFNIEEYITPLTLAVWTMENGSYKNDKLQFITKFNSIKDTENLIIILKNLFNLDIYLENLVDSYPKIIISENSLELFRTIVKPYLIDSMYHKIGLFSPVVIYSNVELDKSKIFLENKDKSGVYIWTNNITKSSYVGSSVNLNKRFSNYFSNLYLKKEALKSNSIIIKALLKYGYSNFSLSIIEYCEPELALNREQIYLDLLKPKYNILPKSNSSLGYKHTKESIEKIRLISKNRKFSKDTLLKLRKHLNELNSLKGFKVEVFDSETNSNYVFESIRKAAIFMKTDIKSISMKEKSLYGNINNINSTFPYKGRYFIKIMRDKKEIINSNVLINNENDKEKLDLILLSKNKWENSKGKILLVTNMDTNITKEYNSISNLALDLKGSRSTIRKYLNSDKLFRNLFKITVK
jgi:hypothetical protein